MTNLEPQEDRQMPALFIGHGNPMIALQNNRYTEAWKEIGERLPKPSAILMVSAHWYVSETAVTVSTSPKTIHDFGGFPDELFQVQYPAPGDPALAKRVTELFAPVEVKHDDNWGLDHGAWSVLKHIYPNADIPVVQLSINSRVPAQLHYDIGQMLAPLRDENVLIIGSGNVVHNLRKYDWTGSNVTPTEWALRFESKVKELTLSGDHKSLINFESLGSDAKLSIPTVEHYLPLLYVLGSRLPDDQISFPVEGIEGGTISMLAVALGT